MGPYNIEILKMLYKETQIQIELPTPHCYIMRTHVTE